MNKILLSLIIALGIGLPVSAYSACFKQVALGEYHLGEWGYSDGTVALSAIVGSTTKRVGGNQLKSLRDRYIRQCDKRAKKLIKKGKKLFPDQADQLERWYLNNANSCKQSYRNKYNQLEPLMCSNVL